ncbi:hypothetical protein CC85DRAFT_285241 [Cutaneotrichosporon oleaginosum]|uniref:Homeodomain-like protein n=1 Tax=Cutaneotrichosporon oleaginosum TaxID=879819 RepID=A0A0J0XNP2_9TREE|nr:uncharacterized protein CC85DRAFT_285241 [Cutaneotrichosporon oleaginosum]KLT42702.1 hypothetical protein CC85DRAFT_285241 [Cutaneotrichosporon oleaginosum]TXT09579.1 hypothetical protein COLE_03513 [Cutaneotrichosporon oleaginosum]
MTATLSLFNPLGDMDILSHPPAAPTPVESTSTPEGHRPRRRWTADEDARLIAAVKKYGSQRGPGSQWSKISAGLPGRTNKDCRKRWFHSLDPRVRKGRWSPEEDELLRKLYAELGPQWKAIALRIPGRKDDQVSKRWRDVLAPELTSKKPWSDEEDALLLALLEEKGPKWTAIAEQLPGRSPIACRNRSRKYRKPAAAAPSITSIASTPARSSPASSPEGAYVDLLLAQAAQSQPQHPPHHSTAHVPSHDHDWHLPQLGAVPPTLDLFNFDVANAPLSGLAPVSGVSGVSGISGVTGSDAAEHGLLENWLASMGGVPSSTTSSASSASATLPVTTEHATPDSLATLATTDKPLQMLYGHSDTPVNNMWSLCLALDRGEHSVTVSSELLRHLIAYAPQKLRQEGLSMELS